MMLFYRLSALTTPPVELTSQMNLSLQEILIIGSCNDQVKFSELTIDMFRILQTLEREASDDYHVYDGSPRHKGFPSTPGAPSTRGNICI